MRGNHANRRPNPRLMPLSKAPKDHVHIGLCLTYSGAAFRGLQLQAHSPTCHTVEGVLVQALKDAGLIRDVVRGRPEGDQHHFARACRTDRGVHAIRNMISIFLHRDAVEKAGGLDGARSQINARLPATVRVAHAMLLAGNFIPRHCCNRRVYRYMLPVYALLPPCDSWATLEKYYPGCFAELQALAQGITASQRTLYGVPYVDIGELGMGALASASSSSSPGASIGSSTPAEVPPARSWAQDTQARIAFCNRILASYFTGSRRYHNFSVDVDSNRSSVNVKVVHPDTDEALRVIYRCELFPRVFFFPCATPQQHGPSLFEYQANMQLGGAAVGGICTSTQATAAPLASPPVLPFVLFQIEGGSFLLNMIRKIVGSLLAVCRGARESVLEDALNPERRVTTPLAPGPYLYLAQSTYHGYDRSLGGLKERRLSTVQEAWAGAVDDVAENFAFRDIAADIVDADLNLLPPLDDMLAAREAALAVRRPHTATEDAHLGGMKEYKPVLPSRTPWPACSEMTRFLRLLRVHNWNLRPIRLNPDCKALKEVRNRQERATAAVIATSAALPASTEAVGERSASHADPTATQSEDALSSRLPSAVDEASERAEIPAGGTDGWLYPANSPAEAAAQQQAYFASRWKRARPWEFASATADVGGEDDEADEGESVDVAPSTRKCRVK